MVGTVVGSFLNVCIYRIPWEKSVIWPASHCPKCLAEIEAYDNLPVLGWLFLGGACRSCKAPIPVRYPAVELLVGLLFAGVYLVDGVLPREYVRDDVGVVLAKVSYHVVLVALLVAITFIDADLTIVPASITNLGIVLGLAIGAAFPERPAHSLGRDDRVGGALGRPAGDARRRRDDLGDPDAGHARLPPRGDGRGRHPHHGHDRRVPGLAGGGGHAVPGRLRRPGPRLWSSSTVYLAGRIAGRKSHDSDREMPFRTLPEHRGPDPHAGLALGVAGRP